MRTTDPNTQIQQLLKRTAGGILTPTQQYPGIYDATILDTDATNSSLPTGQCRVTIESIDSTFAFGPCPYPGAVAPPNGTSCVVGFITQQENSTAAVEPRVLDLEGFGGAFDTPLHPFLLMGA